jgi:hypothetical protein
MAGSGDLLRVLLPAEAVPARGRVLALELYTDGLLVRVVIPSHDDFPYPPWEAATFALHDDAGTAYLFEGFTAGGQPTHGIVTFSPAAPPDTRWIETITPAGRARFNLT